MGEKILLIDDELQFCRVLRIALSAHGYRVHDAQSGEEALGKLQAEIPGVVLLDMNLPGMNGPETCRAIRSISDVPIVILSVRGSNTDKQEAFEAGANAYITKPFRLEELLAQLRLVVH